MHRRRPKLVPPTSPSHTSPRSSARRTATGRPVISIRGARTHNLKQVDLDIPRNALTVITGLSGSGKSSLAFDTLHAEGQRQYIESLSAYARQFFSQLQRPEVDAIDGLPPTLCIDQRQASVNPRSTVGTVTEIYDFLRLLMARVGTPECFVCGQPIEQQSASQVIDSLMQLPAESKLTLLSPLVRARKGGHQEVFQRIAREGLVRMRVDGELCDVDDPPKLKIRQNHTIEAVVDRLVIRPGCEQRLTDAVHLALRLSDGLVQADWTGPASTAEPHQRLFSTRYACAACGASFPEIEPRSFSFNSPHGACPKCEGTGRERDREERFIGPCPVCDGSRLRPEARAVRLENCSIDHICRLPISQLPPFLERLNLTGLAARVATPIIDEMRHRLEFLAEVGIGYLTLERSADTLSGGELQRVRLATSIGSGLVGVCYVLDEPSIGLHCRDNQRLIDSLRRLQQQGNTVVVVEHDAAIMEQSDFLVDVGPGAGTAGGQIVASGTPAQVRRHPTSLTAGYLRGELRIELPPQRRPALDNQWLRIVEARVNNLEGVDVDLPLGCLVGISGVSGSGKSSLINQTLVPAVKHALGTPGSVKVNHLAELLGQEHLDKLIEINQTPIGRTPRSTPATYCGAFDEIRKVYAGTRDARQRGYASNRFSFNAGAGRCTSCQGQGVQKIEMNFLPDVYVTCNQCNGSRYNRQTLQVRYRDRSIADVLNMSVDEGVSFFENFSKIHRTLLAMQQVGLGYLRLGQGSPTLSGGEAQRLKLATELARPDTGRTLYVLDEPTTGLHVDDVRRLLASLNQLVERGNSVIVIEHDLDVIKCCDWVVDLGPEAGPAGGKIVGVGTPEQLADKPESLTGQWLGKFLTGRR